MHGGPFGPGTLNPFNANDPKNYAGHWPGTKRQVPTRSLPQSFPTFHSPGSFIETFSHAFSHTSMNMNVNTNARVGTQTQTSAYATLRNQHTLQQRQRQKQSQSTHPKGVMCLHVCPKNKAATPDDEAFGGPFGTFQICFLNLFQIYFLID